MQEKIARKYLDHKYKCDWDVPENPHWIEWKKEGLFFAKVILSLPVEGCGEVKVECPYCFNGVADNPDNDKTLEPCSYCQGTGSISRPLTLGELPEQARKMREVLEKVKKYLDEEVNASRCDYNMYSAIRVLVNEINDALTFKGKKED